MAVGDTCVSRLSHTSTNTNFFPKPPTSFLTCFSRDERRKYAEEKFCLNSVLNPQTPGHESYMLTTNPAKFSPNWPSGLGGEDVKRNC